MDEQRQEQERTSPGERTHRRSAPEVSRERPRHEQDELGEQPRMNGAEQEHRRRCCQQREAHHKPPPPYPIDPTHQARGGALQHDTAGVPDRDPLRHAHSEEAQTLRDQGEQRDPVGESDDRGCTICPGHRGRPEQRNVPTVIHEVAKRRETAPGVAADPAEKIGVSGEGTGRHGDGCDERATCRPHHRIDPSGTIGRSTHGGWSTAHRPRRSGAGPSLR